MGTVNKVPHLGKITGVLVSASFCCPFLHENPVKMMATAKKNFTAVIKNYLTHPKKSLRINIIG